MKQLVYLLSLAIVTAPTLALAGPKEKARPHIKRATAAHQAGDYEKALSELKAAYAIHPDPELHYAIGQVYAKLGNCNDATSHYEQFAQSSKDPAVKTAVSDAIRACEPKSTVASPSPSNAEPPPGTGVSDSPGPEPESPSETGPSPWYKDNVGNVLVAGGTVLVIAGLVVYSGARAKLDDAESAESLERYNELVDSARSGRTMSVLLVAGGLGLVAGGVVRYMRRDSGKPRESQPSTLGVTPTNDGGLITWMGRF